MKNLPLFFAVLSCAVCFLLGFSSGVSLRVYLSPSSSFQPSVSDCTCAVCLPDHYCVKCRHKSRDCPRLSWYFKRATNTVQRLVK